MTTSRPLLDADYAAIEARIVNWLAGQEDALDRFRAYDAAKTDEEKHKLDPYRIQASSIYGISVNEVNKFPQRFVGKGTVLGAGFGLGPPAFRVSCKKVGKYDLPQGLEYTAIKKWRIQHKKVVQGWEAIDEAAKNAIIRKGQIFEACRCKFIHKDIEGLPFLLIRLPSGRKLAYPRPKIRPHRRFEGKTEITFFGHIKGALWGEVSTWGGKIIQNLTEGVQSDIMACGAHNCERAGYQIATLIHDQALAYHQEVQTPEEFVRLLTDLPSWAAGLPIAAEGALVPFYRKE